MLFQNRILLFILVPHFSHIYSRTKEAFLTALILSHRQLEETSSRMFLIFQDSEKKNTTMVDLEATINSLLESSRSNLIHPEILYITNQRVIMRFNPTSGLEYDEAELIAK